MEDHSTEKVPSVCSQRWILAYVFSAGFFFVYALRVNISVALVCMVKTPVTNSSVLASTQNNNTQDDQCGELQVQRFSEHQGGEFEWDKGTQSYILASFFYGYILTQIPGGWLADRFGGWRVFGIAMAISGISTILIPVCARTSIALVYALRVILGLASGVIFPSCYSMLGRWSPCLERSKLAAISQVGAVVGIVGTFAASGVLCEYGFDNGWGSIFYITGGLCCIWVMFWFVLARDSPEDHPRITQAEKNYIVKHIEFDTTKRSNKVPWKQMATSLPLWSIFICHMCGTWADYTLITSLPAFMKGVLKFDIKSNGAVSSIPYICSAIMAVVAGHSADYLRSRHYLTTTQTRKIYQSIGNVGAGVFLVATGFIPCEKREVAITFLCIAVMSTSLANGGYSANFIDLAPKYAGVMFGLSNTLATIPGMISPIVVGALTPNDAPDEWRNVFYVGAAFYAFGTTFYVICASGKIQPWAKDTLQEADITFEVDELSVTFARTKSI